MHEIIVAMTALRHIERRRNQMSRFVVLWCVLATMLIMASGAYASSVFASSDFDVDADGWTVYGDAQGSSVIPTYNPTGGNPGGFISAKDDVAGGVWYWNAPSKFRGDISSAYGELLTFDLKQSLTDTQFSSEDIVLVGSGLTIYYDTSYNPNTTWTAYSIGLTEAGWKVSGSNAAVTQAQMISVLSSVTAMRIRGEYRTGADTGGLDNVVLYAVPEPGCISVLVAGSVTFGVGIVRRRHTL